MECGATPEEESKLQGVVVVVPLRFAQVAAAGAQPPAGGGAVRRARVRLHLGRGAVAGAACLLAEPIVLQGGGGGIKRQGGQTTRSLPAPAAPGPHPARASCPPLLLTLMND